MVKILFYDTKPYDKKLFEDYNKHYGFEIKYLESKLNNETAPLAAGYDAVCIFVNDIADKETLEILKNCGVKLVVLRCAGFNNVDIQNLPDGMKVVRVPRYSPYAVAEHAVALLLTLDRKTYKSYQRTKKYNFTLNGLLGFDIHGKTVGVIGTGKIGKVFIQIMKGFGTEVLAYDIYKDEEAAKEIEGADVTGLKNAQDIMNALSANQYDAAVVDLGVAKNYVSNGTFTMLDDSLVDEQNYVIAKLGNTEIIDKINKCIETLLASDEYQTLCDKYGLTPLETK